MKESELNAKIAFIGLGVMGQSMAMNLLKSGSSLKVFTRTKSKSDELVKAGACWCDSVADCVAGVDVVITIIGYPSDVRKIYFDENGILNSVDRETLLIDMTTSEPSLAKEIAILAAEKGCQSLDAPVSGGDIGARNATLSIMVGGAKEAFERADKIFKALGKTIVYQGAAGAGQHTKMANQIAIATNMIGVMEALIYSREAGLDPMVVLESIGSGAAGSWSLTNLYPRVVKEDYEPGFYVVHFIKDMKIAVQESLQMGLELPGLNLALSFYEELAAEGQGLLGTQAIYKIIDKHSRQVLP